MICGLLIPLLQLRLIFVICSVCCTFSFPLIQILTPGENSHLLLSILVKHLDHKNIVKQPDIQICIVNVVTHLVENAKEQASATIVGVINDLIKHLRKCMQYSTEASSTKDGLTTSNSNLQSALEKCILQLSKKVCL